MEYGIDCSLNNCGIAMFENGVLQELKLLRNDTVKYPKKMSKGEILAEKIGKIIQFIDANCFLCANKVYIEKPSGSQSASGMINYTVEVAIYSYLRSRGYKVQWVKVNDVKKELTGDKNASKSDMIDAAHKMYPHSLNLNYDWLTDKNGRLYNYNEHLADSIAIYLAGNQK